MRRGFATSGGILASLRGSVLDILARRLPQRDRETLIARWGVSVSNHLAPSTQLESSQSSQVTEQVTKSKSTGTVAVPPVVLPPAEAFKDKELLNPLFGELIADLDYKRVYLTNVSSLAVIPVWEKNRILRPDRARKIANAKSADKFNTGLPGVITCFSEVGTKRCGIVDGQHRAASLVMLCNDGLWDVQKRNVLVDVFDVQGEQQIISLFREINAGEPVKLVDMPDDEGHFADALRVVLNEAVESFEKQYPDMFKASSRCRVPHLHAGSVVS